MSEDTNSGINSGIARALVSNPFDCIRVYIQNSNKKITTNKAISNIMKTQGIIGFYRGINPFIFGNIYLLSVYHSTYKKYKEKYGSFISGGLGGMYGSVVANTLEYYRAQYFANKFIFKSTNILRSLPITIIRDFIGWGSFFTGYSITKEKVNNMAHLNQTLIVGSISGIFLWTSMYPLDTIKTRIQTNNTSIIDTIKQCYKIGGIKKFWAGYSSCLIRAIPVNIGITYFL